MTAYSEIFMDVSAALAAVGEKHGTERFAGRWDERHWMNTPGPLYCSETDNSGAGPLAAPNSVLVDNDGFEAIFRQPVNHHELRQVLRAAECDVFSAYAADGDSHWTLAAIRAWWAGSREIGREVERQLARLTGDKSVLTESVNHVFFAGLLRWRDYFKEDMHLYLRVYAFFLEEGRIPAAEDRLPDV